MKASGTYTDDDTQSVIVWKEDTNTPPVLHGSVLEGKLAHLCSGLCVGVSLLRQAPWTCLSSATAYKAS